MRYATILLALFTFPAHAGELGLIVDTFSHHFETRPAPVNMGGSNITEKVLQQHRRPWNEHNRSLGVEYTLDGDDWRPVFTLAHYVDSRQRPTWYGGAGLSHTLFERGGLRVDGVVNAFYFKHEGFSEVIAPGITYIEKGGSRFAPMPGLAVVYNSVGVNVALIPPVDGSPWTAALQLKVLF